MIGEKISNNLGESEGKSAGLWLAISFVNSDHPLAKPLLTEMIAKDPKLCEQLRFLGVEV